jgi:hypothetical protein
MNQKSMATNEEDISITKILSILSNEEELIIKPFQSGKIIIISSLFSMFFNDYSQ